MVYKNGDHTCYVYAVPPHERHLVHTESGMFTLEVIRAAVLLNLYPELSYLFSLVPLSASSIPRVNRLCHV
jgi:hypothetical protein